MYRGLLKLSETTSIIEFALFNGNECNSFSQILNNKLMDEVRITISVGKKIHKQLEGELLLIKEGRIYKYFIGNECLDDILFSNIGKYIEFDLKVIKGVKEDEC